MKLCECGCGQPTTIAKYSSPRDGYTKGEARRFVRGHYARMQPNGKHYSHRRINGEQTTIHRLRAEKALGKTLPLGVEVHHADGSKGDAAPLVICEDHAYHMALHTKMRVKAAGGDPWRDKICSMCKQVKSKDAFGRDARYPEDLDNCCRDCRIVSSRRRYAEKKQAAGA